MKTPPRRRRARPSTLPCSEGGRAPAFILTVDAATRNFTVRKVGASAEPGQTFELWLISDKLPRPRSLGVIGNRDFTPRPVLASYDSDVINNATYALGGAGRWIARRRPALCAGLYRQADRDRAAGGARSLNRSAPKRKRPWGAGVFDSQLGGSWGLLLSTWRLGGLVKSRVNS